LEGPGVWQTLGKKKTRKKRGGGKKKRGGGLESGKLWGKKKEKKRVYTYTFIHTGGGTYKYVRWGGGLESGKLQDATVDGWKESSEPNFLSTVQMALREFR
jgi:hypothetical protein